MKYKHFKSAIESQHKTSLKKILYEICVVEELNAVEGSKKLGIAKEVFVYWRHYYRFEERQLLFDRTIRNLKNNSTLSIDEAKEVTECCNSTI
ncbi:hypothetical protein [Planococcus halocryophilus]|uniref:hypothetical protein n=1 Tax=Planococcus halocryophilus TaxID=1215089 RepID=UPI001F0FA059|nr:hypothetical protein [Planococcus halocryophilus]MCH4827573.1 hypothetical protein [Planococcus halocryophilus]